MKFGKYQWGAFILLSLVLIVDGADAMLVPLLISILEHEWKLTSSEMSIMSSSFFVGLLVGVLLGGKLSDTYGRKNIVIRIPVFIYIFGVAVPFTPNYIAMSIVLFFKGAGVGIQFPVTEVFLAEVTPKHLRGAVLTVGSAIFAFGELFTCFLGYFCLDNVYSGNWKALAFSVV